MSSELGAQLSGRTFVSRSATGITLVEGAPITLTFESARLGVHAGCNRIFGPISWRGKRLDTGGGLASTMMACPDPIAAQESAILQVLNARPMVDWDGEQLTLRDPGSPISIEFIEQQAPRVVDTCWELTALVQPEGVYPVPGASAASIQITDTQVQVHFGCNTGGGSAEITAGAIEFGPLRMTRKMCLPEVMEIERQMAQVLQGRVSYVIDSEGLTLENGGLGLRFVAR